MQGTSGAGPYSSERMSSATRSPIIIVGKLMFALGTVGMTEASATCRFSIPRSRH